GPETTVTAAVELLRSTGISQLPVLEGGRPVGGIQEMTLARVLHDRGDPGRVAVGRIMARPLPHLDDGRHLAQAHPLLLAGNTGGLATAGGEVVDIVTRIDLIQFWS